MANVLPRLASELGHIFRLDEGHIPDTPANRELLLSVANDEMAWLVQDKYRTEWFARMQADGTQVWAQVRNGRVVNGGVNKAPRNFNTQTGLKRL